MFCVPTFYVNMKLCNLYNRDDGGPHCTATANIFTYVQIQACIFHSYVGQTHTFIC
jgi:hypothetical protein